MEYHELETLLKQMSKEDLGKLVASANKLLLNESDISNTESKLCYYGINSKCPYCGSSIIVKNGRTQKGNTRYICTSCKKSYTRFTNTLLEKSHYDWDIWVEVLKSAILHQSVLELKETLEKDYGCLGIDDYTVWLLRMKVIYAVSQLKSDRLLSGVIQIDETFIRESQKGSRHLVSMLNGVERKARYGYHASKLGCMGPEFSTVVTAIDETGHCICYVTCMGKLTESLFRSYFVDSFSNVTFLCTDANTVYNSYCDDECIAHYIKDSDYLKTLKDNGYIFGLKSNQNNKDILKKLYDNGLIDKIENYGKLSFSEFDIIKKKYGLSLGRVNELHKDIKKYIESEMTNVSMEYLEYYIGFFTYIRNWRVDNGHYPVSKEDTEKIFVEILKSNISITYNQVSNLEMNKQKITKRYENQLKSNTNEARTVLNESRFKFREEDNVQNFNKKEILEKLPLTEINKMFRECGYRGRLYSKWTKTSRISAIAKHEKCNELIYKYLETKREKVLDDEGIKEINSQRYK